MDSIINLCCTNMFHYLYFIESHVSIDPVSWKILGRVDSLTASSSHGTSVIRCHALIWHNPPAIWVVCVLFYTKLPLFHHMGQLEPF